jgi:hypothetical protein
MEVTPQVVLILAMGMHLHLLLVRATARINVLTVEVCVRIIMIALITEGGAGAVAHGKESNVAGTGLFLRRVAVARVTVVILE